MTTNLLFGHFTSLATAPGGIALLRDMILQLAMQGKLGTQDTRDEPANILLKKILIEKRGLTRNLKKGLNSGDLTDPKINDKYPNNWVLTRLIGVIDFYRGKRPNELFSTPKKYPYIDIDAFERNRIKQFSDEENLTMCDDSNLIIVTDGSRSGLVGFGRYGILGSTLGKIVIFEGIDKKYLYYFLKSNYNIFNKNKTGAAIPHLDMNLFREMQFPLPPIAEQHRIVAKVEKLMALCDDLEAKQQQERAGCLRLGTASLMALQNTENPEEFERKLVQVCEAFEAIFDCSEIVATLRKTILQLAVKGQLVRQQSEDEPASELLEKIQKEKEMLVKDRKSKKEKSLEPVHEDELPYSLPNKWMWCRFGDIATIETNLVSPEDFQDFPHIAPDNIEKGTGRILQYRTVAEDDVQSPNHHFYPNRIIYSKIRPNLSKLAIVDFEGLCSADMYPINSHIFNQYLKIYMLSSPFYKQAVSDENRLAMPKINQSQLNTIYVAVPPLAEQYRIVAKVSSLMTLCDLLEKQLKDRSDVQERFANMVAKQMVSS